MRLSSSAKIATKNVMTNINVIKILRDAKIQKDWRDGKIVVPPTRKATISVNDVIVIDTPACLE